MIVMVKVTHEGDTEALRDLSRELAEDGAWRGRVELVERPPGPGELGPMLDALRIVLDPAVVTPFLGLVAAWLRFRTSDVDVTIERTGDKTTVRMSGKRLRQLDVTALGAELAKMARPLDAIEGPPSGGVDGD
jgi:hypothetical protein